MIPMVLGKSCAFEIRRIVLTCCSDAFAGGFVAGIVQGKDLKSCVDMGQWLAKLSIQELGPSYPYPKQIYTA